MLILQSIWHRRDSSIQIILKNWYPRELKSISPLNLQYWTDGKITFKSEWTLSQVYCLTFYCAPFPLHVLGLYSKVLVVEGLPTSPQWSRLPATICDPGRGPHSNRLCLKNSMEKWPTLQHSGEGVVHGMDSCWRNSWRTVSCGKDPTQAEEGLSSLSSIRNNMSWNHHNPHSLCPCTAAGRKESWEGWTDGGKGCF